MFPPTLELIECNDLYNVLNAEIDGLARISDTNYLYLLDCRPRKDYDESHIISARLIQRVTNESDEYRMPWRAELETREHIVLYDSRTDSLPLKEGDDIYRCAELLQSYAGGLITIKILRGGYQLFSKFYPFHRTQRSLYSPKELELIQTYPNEICSSLVYLGRRDHAINTQIVKDLKIRAFVNCTTHEDYLVPGGDARKYFHFALDDQPETTNLFDLLRDAVHFIAAAYARGDPVLVYSDRGVSRSAAVLVAFISFHKRLNSKNALEFVEHCRPIRPQHSFLEYVDQLNEKLNDLKDAMANAEQTTITEHDE